MLDLVTNFAYGTILTAPSPKTSGTSFVLNSGQGALFPSIFPFNIVVWPSGVQPSSSNAEIMTVTGRTTDTFTVTRTQESSTNQSVDVGWQVMQGPTAKTISDLPITSLFRQAIINGNFDVWLRGTSFTLGATAAYTADRWYAWRSSTVTGESVSQQAIVASALTGSFYCARVQRVVSDSQTNTINLNYSMESHDSIQLIGQTLTLSFYARAGSNYSASSNVLVSKILTGTGTDEKSSGYTGSSTAGTQNNTLTTSWNKFTMTLTSTIGTSVTEIGINFSFTPTGTAGTNDYFEITQVQLCAGGTALTFMPKSFDEELRACKRYFEKSYDYGTALATNIDVGGSQFSSGATSVTISNLVILTVKFAVEKRTSPTVTTYDYVGTANKCSLMTGSSGGLTNAIASTVDQKCTTGFRTYAAYTATTQAGVFYQWGADAEL